MTVKRSCFVIGLLIVALAWLLLALGDKTSFSIHMIVHMAVVAAAAPFLAYAMAGGSFDFVSRSRVLTPVTASMLELVTVWGWHLPAAREWAEASMLARVFEQACFLAAGLILWLACLGGTNTERDSKRLGGVLGLLFTSMHMTLLGALLALSPRPLYGAGEVTCFGIVLSAGQDQQIGGVIMLMVGAAVYLAGGVALLGRTLREPEPNPLGDR
ncbi:cytochrome c oxidase assembly protein [Rhizobium lemnae]|uniref:Cytochrome c oxidase assembly protein n=1 Tax=Rhizobium lemnae TaxID=1214924 RepID=A0ABV8E4J1_9HYPH|nr:cytochrome c oxidase assembly protein [Rhizobium lemnae]MCJ8507317.1 cytochrome c oxidase assembly protein [Rhizobium lemnae]